MPKAREPTPIRPPANSLTAIRNPSFNSPSRADPGTRQASKITWFVDEACWPILSSALAMEIPGVAGTTFLKTALNAIRKYRGEGELDAMEFLKYVRAKAKELGVSDEMLRRLLNVGFSGGEK